MKVDPKSPAERRKAVQKALIGVLQSDECFVVVCTEEGVTVSNPLEYPISVSRLRDERPDAYGRLGALSERISVGVGWIWFGVFAVIIAVFVAHATGLLKPVLGPALNSALAREWIYGFLIFLGVGFAVRWHMVYTRRRYQALRGQVEQLANELGMDMPTLLGMISGDASLDALVRHMRRDRFAPTSYV